MVSKSRGATYQEVFKRVEAYPVAFYLVLAELCGSLHAGLMLSQVFYWNDRTTLQGGWFYKSEKEWRQELYLSKSQQKTARKILVSRGFVREEKRGLPGTMHFRLEAGNVFDALRQFDEKRRTGVQESGQLVGPKPANKRAINQQTFHIGTKTTSKTTALGATKRARHVSVKREEQRQTFCDGRDARTQAQFTSAPNVADSGHNPWPLIKAKLKATMDPHHFETWMKPCRFAGADGTLVLTVPTMVFAEMCEHSRGKILAAIQELKLPLCDVRFEVRGCGTDA